MLDFTFVIPTKNRVEDLKKTLSSLEVYINDPKIEFIVFDDGSNDSTGEFVTKEYPSIIYKFNKRSKGIHFVRNQLLGLVKTKYLVSIDDDANFLTTDFLEDIRQYFNDNPKVAILPFRAYWNLLPPTTHSTNQKSVRTKGFGAVSFAMRTDSWQKIPNLLEWFKFYGEEDFISYQLYRQGLEIHYFPKVLVHHRVNIKSRKKQKDYRLRLRRSLRSGWYLFVLFYPLHRIPRIFIYTIWMQIKTKVLKGDVKALRAIIQAFFDVIFNLPRLFYNSNRLSEKEFQDYLKIHNTILYWTPEDN